jgi:hypothetical protein
VKEAIVKGGPIILIWALDSTVNERSAQASLHTAPVNEEQLDKLLAFLPQQLVGGLPRLRGQLEHVLPPRSRATAEGACEAANSSYFVGNIRCS